MLIFAATLVAVLTRPRNVSEGMSAALGAAVLLLTGCAGWNDLVAVLGDNLTVLAFFLGMMTLTTLAEEARVFERMAAGAAALAGGSPRRLFLNVFGLGVIISTFLTNDATALIVTPIVYALVTRLRLDPLPYVFACTFVADTASMTLPISNPINIILGQRFHVLSLGGYLHYLLLPSLCAIVINTAGFAFLFRNRLQGTFSAPRSQGILEPAERRAFLIAVAVLVLVGVAFVAASGLPGSPVGAVAMAGAATLLVATRMQGRLVWRRLAGGISWGIFPFVAGTFLLVRGLERQGVASQLGHLLGMLAGHGTIQAALSATFFGALCSNLINNVPAVAVISAAIPTLHHVPRSAIVYGTIVGCDLGPNLTVTGSLSTMIWLLILRRRNMDVSALDYAKLGLVVTPIMLLASGLMLGLLL